jgi:hypothetical protein
MPVGGIRAAIVCRDEGSAEKLESRIDLKPTTHRFGSGGLPEDAQANDRRQEVR